MSCLKLVPISNVIYSLFIVGNGSLINVELLTLVIASFPYRLRLNRNPSRRLIAFQVALATKWIIDNNKNDH